jgi:hypothetical protein
MPDKNGPRYAKGSKIKPYTKGVVWCCRRLLTQECGDNSGAMFNEHYNHSLPNI